MAGRQETLRSQKEDWALEYLLQNFFPPVTLSCDTAEMCLLRLAGNSHDSVTQRVCGPTSNEAAKLPDLEQFLEDHFSVSETLETSISWIIWILSIYCRLCTITMHYMK